MAARGRHVQLDHMYSCDLETCDDLTNDIYKLNINEENGVITPIYPQKVWLAGHMNLQTKQMVTYNNMDDFMRWMLSRRDNQNIEVAFHNLRFDGSFIVPWLLRHGYNASLEKPEIGEFSILIDKMNSWYMITLQITKRRKVTIWDTAKLFPMKLERLHDLYGTPTKKLKEPSTFYDLYRGPGHELTEDEHLYFRNDLTVLAETLCAHIEHYGLLFKKTQASQAFNEFEKSFTSWKRRFPPLEEHEDKDIRPAYWGGISYVSPQHQGKNQYNIGVYDINSSYPYQQAYKKLPYGPPLYIYENETPDMSKFWIASVLIKFTLKENKIPCIPKKAVEEGEITTSDRWLHNSEGVVVIKFCSIDYMTIQDSYDFEILEWIKVIHYAWKVHPEIQKYILHNNEEKVKYKKLSRTNVSDQLKIEYKSRSQRAKINNNSYYGKFGEDIIKEGKTPYLSDDDVIYIQDREEVQGKGKRKYLPVAIATTAWGRHQLVTFGNLLGSSFLYCDTDSVHYLREPGDKIIDDVIKHGLITVSPTDLGAWDLEGYFDRGRYLRSKCYYEENYTHDHPEVTLAGLPADNSLSPKKRTCCTWDNFHIGLQIKDGNGKLQSVRTPTGNKLLPTKFEITEKTSIFGF